MFTTIINSFFISLLLLLLFSQFFLFPAKFYLKKLKRIELKARNPIIHTEHKIIEIILNF